MRDDDPSTEMTGDGPSVKDTRRMDGSFVSARDPNFNGECKHKLSCSSMTQNNNSAIALGLEQ
jgi:hypothetical protein